VTKQNLRIVEHYQVLKEEYPDCILCFKIGEFYQMFENDALIVSKMIGLVISYKTNEKVPMCGFPKSTLEVYVYRIMLNGYKVAVCEEQKAPDGKITREVTRVYTKGTMVEEDFLEGTSSNFILLYTEFPEPSYSVTDISTGELYVGTGDISLGNLMYLWDPVECILDQRILGTKTWSALSQFHDRFSFFDMQEVDKYQALTRAVYDDSTLVDLNENEITCIGVTLNYIQYTQKAVTKHIKPPRRQCGHVMRIPNFTITNVELFRTLDGKKTGSIYDILCKTVTGPGSRLFRQRLQAPSTQIDIIKDRLNTIEYFINNKIAGEKSDLFYDLKAFADLERIVARINFNRVTLRDLHNAIASLKVVQKMLTYLPVEKLSYELTQSFDNMALGGDLLDILTSIVDLSDESTIESGTFIKAGYDAELDQLKEKRSWIMEQVGIINIDYQKLSKLSKVNIKSSEVLGFYVEVPKAKLPFLPYDLTPFQELAGSVRLRSQELENLSRCFTFVTYQIRQRGKYLFNEVVSLLMANRDVLTGICSGIAVVDLGYSMAQFAIQHEYCRPELCEDTTFEIKGGHNLILEKYKDDVKKNDCSLTDPILLTGFNMSGKTTYLKQNAIIALMAHVGLYVPCVSARIGLIDALFVRIGGYDDMRNGKSTFMVEMDELGHMLNTCTTRSLVMIDEIGRGTAAKEGLEIAKAVLYYLRDHKIRSIFATHYTELAKLPDIKKMRMKVDGNSWSFLYEVEDGHMDRSYAVAIGKLAGVPSSILESSQENHSSR